MIDSNDFRELLALKRVGPIRGSTNANVVLVPEGSGDQDLCIYLLSDAYLGLDQQYDLHLHVEEEVVGEGEEFSEIVEFQLEIEELHNSDVKYLGLYTN